MSLVINSKETMENTTHHFGDYMAFLDDDGDFWLIDEEDDYVTRLTDRGCICQNTSEYDTIEDFLLVSFGCKLVKVFNKVEDFKIVIEC